MSAALCCLGHLAASLASAHWKASALPNPSCDDQNRLQALISVRVQDYLDENYCSVVLHCVNVPQSILPLTDGWVEFLV